MAIQPQPGKFSVKIKTSFEEDSTLGEAFEFEEFGFEDFTQQVYEFCHMSVDRPNLPPRNVFSDQVEVIKRGLIARSVMQDLDKQGLHARATNVLTKSPIEVPITVAQAFTHLGSFKLDYESFTPTDLPRLTGEFLSDYCVRAHGTPVNGPYVPHARAASYAAEYFSIDETGELVFTTIGSLQRRIEAVTADIINNPPPNMTREAFAARREFIRELLAAPSVNSAQRLFDNVNPNVGRTTAQLNAAFVANIAPPNNNNLRDLVRAVFNVPNFVYPQIGNETILPLNGYRAHLAKLFTFAKSTLLPLKPRVVSCHLPRFDGGSPSQLAQYGANTMVIASRRNIAAADVPAAFVLGPRHLSYPRYQISTDKTRESIVDELLEFNLDWT